ncbi:MAG: hypothetical protein WDM88_10780 [Galbitalea sp.]
MTIASPSRPDPAEHDRPRPFLSTAIASVVVLGALLAIAAAPAAQAANPPSNPSSNPSSNAVTWGVQPATSTAPDSRKFFDYDVQAGSIITDHVAVTNFSATPVTFHIYAADGITDYDSARFTLIGADTPSTDLGSWTSVGGGPFTCPDTDTKSQQAACAAKFGVTETIAAKTTAVVPFTIAVPANAAPGDHAAGIVASYIPASAAAGTITVNQRVGTRVYLRVAGATKSKLAVAGSVASYSGGWNLFTGGTATLGFDLRNIGNTRLSADPSATLTGPFGIPLGTITAAPVEDILPGGRAHVEATVKNVPPLLLLFANITVKPTAGDGNVANDTLPAVVTASTVTWAVPWTLLIVLVVIAAAIVGIVWWRRRSRERLAVALGHFQAQVERDTLERAAADRAPATKTDTAGDASTDPSEPEKETVS